jgi:hypothetical protein
LRACSDPPTVRRVRAERAPDKPKTKLYRRREAPRAATERWCGSCVDSGVKLERQTDQLQSVVTSLETQLKSEQVSGHLPHCEILRCASSFP